MRCARTFLHLGMMMTRFTCTAAKIRPLLHFVHSPDQDVAHSVLNKMLQLSEVEWSFIDSCICAGMCMSRPCQ